VRQADVVVFKFPQDPTRDFIKRCMGLPGDTLKMMDKNLYVNDRLVNDAPYVYYHDSMSYPLDPFGPRRTRDNLGPWTVPPASYFCLGDNRDESNDSRYWGAVPESYVKGRAFMVYWSFDSGQELTEWPGYGGKLRQVGQVALHFFTRTRWNRTFRIVR
jgi:signal peptidase I